MQRVSWLRVAGVALLAGLVGCGRDSQPAGEASPAGAPPAPPLAIGAIFPLSGGAGRIGEMKRQGADLAVEHLNAAGGVKGRPLKILYQDSKNLATEAGVAFTRLVEVDRVPVVMSAMSQVSLSLAAPADRRQVVLFANASHPALPGKSPFVFRNLPSTRQTATLMAETAYRELDLRKVVVFHVNDEYGADAWRVFEQRFASLGGQVLGVQTFEIGGTDFRAQLTQLARLKPDAWWIPGYGAALGLVLKQKSELRLPGAVLCDLGLVDSNVLETAGAAADRVVVVTPVFDPADPREAVQKFVTDYVAKYQEQPSFDAAFQYDAVYLLAAAMQRAPELTGEAIRQALDATSGFVGVCGPTSFDDQGDAKLQVVARLMLDHKLAPLEKLTTPPAPSPSPSTRPTDEAGPE